MQDNNRLIAHLFALGTTIVWGTTFISSKILLESLTPSEIIVYRFAIAIAFLYLLRPHFFRHGERMAHGSRFCRCWTQRCLRVFSL